MRPLLSLNLRKVFGATAFHNLTSPSSSPQSNCLAWFQFAQHTKGTGYEHIPEPINSDILSARMKKNFPRNQCVLTCICGVMVCDHAQWSLFSWAQCPVNRHALPIVRPKWSVCFDKYDDTTADKYIGRKKLKKKSWDAKIQRCKEGTSQEFKGAFKYCAIREAR